MKHMPRTWKVGAVSVLALTSLAGCIAGGYDGDVGVGYVGGVYEPGGYEYGGWGPGYRVGPPRGGERGHGGGRAAPSIPHAARHGGGGEHRSGGKGH
jgi:hypothetical protein